MKHFILIFTIITTLFSCQENNNDKIAEDLAKEKEELLLEKEKLLIEKEKMLEESAKSLKKKDTEISNVVKSKQATTASKLYDMSGNPCIIGSWYYANIDDVDGYTNIRKSPSTSSKIISQVNDGEEFRVLITNENWLRAIAPDGSQGYISASRVSPTYIEQ